MRNQELYLTRMEAFQWVNQAGKPFRWLVTLLAFLSCLVRLAFSLGAGKLLTVMGVTDLTTLDLETLQPDPGLLALLFGSTVLFFLLLFLVEAVLSAFSLRAARGQDAGWKGFLASLRILPKALGAGLVLLVLVYGIMLLVNLLMLVSLGAMLVGYALAAVLAVVLLYLYRVYLYALGDGRGGIFRTARFCRSITKGRRLPLFFLDLSFLWIHVMINLAINIVSGLSTSISTLGEAFGAPQISQWMELHPTLTGLLFGLLGIAAALPLYYWMLGRISVTFALVYEKLTHRPEADEDHPLSYGVTEE